MSVFLMIVGALAAIGGLAGIGFGIPVKEFSFGNTMIASGAIAFAGGIVTLALGAAVGALRRIAQGMTHAPLPHEYPVPFEAPATAPAVPPPPVAFPSRPKPPAFAEATPEPPPAPPLAIPPAAPAPTLRNPDAPVLPVNALEIPEKEGASLMPEAGLESTDIAEPAPPAEKFLGRPPERHREPPPAFAEEPWTPPPPPRSLEPAPEAAPPSYFDTMWPADTRPPKRPFAAEPESKPDVPADEPSPDPAGILKSGVVDGMAYTLYTDGSIEAELPTGTLHFASINELRDHLAKNS